MKFCIVVDSYKPIYDGVMRYFDGFIPALVALGHSVTVVCPHLPGTKKIEHPFKGLEVLRCFNPGFYQMGYYIALPDKYLVRGIREADFVFIHSVGTLGIFGGILARCLGKKVGLFAHQDERLILLILAEQLRKKKIKVTSYHDERSSLLEALKHSQFRTNFTVTLIGKLFYRLFIDVFFCATERFKGKLMDYWVPESKIIFNPFAIDLDFFSAHNKTKDIRKLYSIPSDALIVLYVGRISKEKNISNLLLALDLAMEKQSNVYALLVGKQSDNKMFSQFPLKHLNRILFTGFVPEEELPSYYCAADIFASPSLHESSCFTVFEAMACGLSVLTSEFRHDKDIIHKHNAILIRNLLDPKAIFEGLNYLLQDKNVRQTIGENGRQLISDRTWKKHIKVFLKVVHSTFR